jgi:hypothetical protein
MKKSIVFPIALVFVLLVSGCVQTGSSGPQCPECSNPSSYSECNDQAIKTRTNYRCSEATDFQCESYTEERQCATEIALSGNIDATVSPSIEEKVKGIIRFEISNVPGDTEVVAYYLAGGNLPDISGDRMPLFATNQGDVWTGMLDTEGYENGLYQVMVIASNSGLEGNPQFYAQGQLLISN